MSLRRKVLASFKNLHRAREAVFTGHTEALTAGRAKINEEFFKNRNEQNPENIEQLIRTADETAEYLKSSVVQAVKKPGTDIYEVNITKDTKMIENVPFDEAWEPPKRRKGKSPCETNSSGKS